MASGCRTTIGPRTSIVLGLPDSLRKADSRLGSQSEAATSAGCSAATIKTAGVSAGGRAATGSSLGNSSPLGGLTTVGGGCASNAGQTNRIVVRQTACFRGRLGGDRRWLMHRNSLARLLDSEISAVANRYRWTKIENSAATRYFPAGMQRPPTMADSSPAMFVGRCWD